MRFIDGIVLALSSTAQTPRSALPLAPTATAAHACLACGRHPATHTYSGDTCGACGLGDEREDV